MRRFSKGLYTLQYLGTDSIAVISCVPFLFTYPFLKWKDLYLRCCSCHWTDLIHICSIRDITKEVAIAVIKEAIVEDLAEGYREMDARELRKLNQVYILPASLTKFPYPIRYSYTVQCQNLIEAGLSITFSFSTLK